jgi:RimJ/RimL family protein N-acetyltransferase
MRIENRKKG